MKHELLNAGTKLRIVLNIKDCGYRFDLSICDCRTDYHNFDRIKNIFMENKDLFMLAHEETINDRHFIFSHAGIHKGYVDFAFMDERENINESNVVDYFNNAYLDEDPKVISSLRMYDMYRGWGGYDYGSLVWADARSWDEENDGYGYNIFGHTQLQHGCGGFITENYALLDSAEAFIINDLGEIKKFS